MTTTTDTTADRALKARHRAMWALGDYPAVAIDVIPELGPGWSRRAACAPGTGCWTWPRAPGTPRYPPR